MLAAVLSYIILHQRDAVPLGIFDEDMKDYAPRSDSKASLHDIMARLAAFDGTQETDIAATAVWRCKRLAGDLRLVSDFFDEEEAVLESIPAPASSAMK